MNETNERTNERAKEQAFFLRIGLIVLYYEAETLVPTTTLLAGVQGRDRQDRAEERE